jgi:hypothetical protein
MGKEDRGRVILMMLRCGIGMMNTIRIVEIGYLDSGKISVLIEVI